MAQFSSSSFHPGQIWLDNDQRPINAHGGGILYHKGVYYWYGEQRPDGPSSLNALIGFSCYSSFDLFSWKLEGTVLSTDPNKPDSPLTPGCKMERPKVIYNPSTKRFVMWWHHDMKGWGHSGALAGVAVSDSPVGPFQLVNILKPNWQMFRDCTVFQDDDKSAHLVYASDDNANLVICRLEDDYLKPTPLVHRFFQGRYMEAPCIFKANGNYYLIASDCTGWFPNEARSAVAPTLYGPWKELGNPCLGDDAEITYGSQSTFVLPIEDKPGAYIFMADQWNPDDLSQSRYVWLPIFFKKTVPYYPPRPFVQWNDQWDLSAFH